jgi:hypothetical protein
MTTTNAAYQGKIKWRITSGSADSLYIHAEIGDGPRAYDVAQAMAAAAARMLPGVEISVVEGRGGLTRKRFKGEARQVTQVDVRRY